MVRLRLRRFPGHGRQCAYWNGLSDAGRPEQRFRRGLPADHDSERDLAEWTEREVFASNGRMEVESEDEDGLALVATYSNDTWGAMRTVWRFTVEGGKVVRFETGQAPAE